MRWPLLLALLAAPSLAADDVPPSAQVSILLKVLSYDRKLESRASGVVKIGLLFRAGDGSSEGSRAAITSAFDDAVAQFNVAGMKVKTVALAWAGAPKLDADLVREHAAAIYLCDGLADEIGTIIKVSRSHSALSLSGSDAYVKSGASVAVARRGSKAAIVINLKSSRAEGADLDSQLLKLAEIVE